MEQPAEAASRPEGKVTTIYEAAAQVFVREGYAGATSKALASAAGVAESTLFRLVNDKESLYSKLFDYAWSEINAWVADAAFVADVAAPERSTDPAETLVADARAIAAMFDDRRKRPLVTFAFDAVGRGPERFTPLSSQPYARFRKRVVSHLDLHQRRAGDASMATDPAALADALLARLRSAWMAWYYTPDLIAVRRPTVEEMTEQLRGDLGFGPSGGSPAPIRDATPAAGASSGHRRRRQAAS